MWFGGMNLTKLQNCDQNIALLASSEWPRIPAKTADLWLEYIHVCGYRQSLSLKRLAGLLEPTSPCGETNSAVRVASEVGVEKRNWTGNLQIEEPSVTLVSYVKLGRTAAFV